MTRPEIALHQCQFSMYAAGENLTAFTRYVVREIRTTPFDRWGDVWRTFDLDVYEVQAYATSALSVALSAVQTVRSSLVAFEVSFSTR